MKKGKKRKILFITERRADYSRIKPIMLEVKKSRKLELLLLVTGAHLLHDFGETKKVIQQDGFKIDAVLPIFDQQGKDDGAMMVQGMGRALLGMPNIFLKLKPDIVFTGFDLGANFAAAITAMHLNIHVSHIQGGEVSGTVDEILRHATTKFAHLHFAATGQSKKRIIKMGENPQYVFNVGTSSLDTLDKISFYSKKTMAKKYGLDPIKPLILFIQHPVTTEVDRVVKQISQSIEAIKLANKKYGAQALAIYSNNDAGGRRIIKKLKESGIKVAPHIVHEDFLRLMKTAAVLVGNSSTAIHEAPSLGLPAVNIGTREQFRERGDNVIDAGHDKSEIVRAIKRALFDKAFLKKVKRCRNPYYQPNTAKKVVKILETIKLPPIQKIINY